jgi:hypothetical protein
MGPILSEPIKQVVEIPKILAKLSVENAKKRAQNALAGPAHRPGEKGEKKHPKKSCVLPCGGCPTHIAPGSRMPNMSGII